MINCDECNKFFGTSTDPQGRPPNTWRSRKLLSGPEGNLSVSIDESFFSYLAVIVWQHLYSRGKFVLKARTWSRNIKKTSNNNKNLVASFETRTEAFQGGGGGVKN